MSGAIMAEWVWQGCHTLLQIVAYMMRNLPAGDCASNARENGLKKTRNKVL